MTSFSFFIYFDAFELDVNVVNFVYYGKTRLTVPVIVEKLDSIYIVLNFCQSGNQRNLHPYIFIIFACPCNY